MTIAKQKKRAPALRCGRLVGSSGHYVRIRKHRGSNVPSYYAACFNSEGTCVAILDADSNDQWWFQDEAKAAGARWIAEQATPSPNNGDQPTPVEH